jgi:hypothetical protein
MIGRQLAALALFGTTASAVPGNQEARDLAQLVVAIDAAEPVSPQSLRALLGVTLRCDNDHHCDGGPLVLQGTRIGHVDLRHWKGGSILIFEDLSGDCVRAEAIAIDTRFSFPMNDCTDGMICLYRSTARRWGRLSLGVPRDLNAPECVRSVVFNGGH